MNQRSNVSDHGRHHPHTLQLGLRFLQVAFCLGHAFFFEGGCTFDFASCDRSPGKRCAGVFGHLNQLLVIKWHWWESKLARESTQEQWSAVENGMGLRISSSEILL